jgi:hypothetical protein
VKGISVVGAGKTSSVLLTGVDVSVILLTGDDVSTRDQSVQFILMVAIKKFTFPLAYFINFFDFNFQKER